jgi:sugar phosphate permease
MISVIGTISEWAKHTVFSTRWWKEHWWVPFVFLFGVVVWLLTKGRNSPVRKVSERINKIRKKEREEIDRVKIETAQLNAKIDDEAREKIKNAVAETKKMMDDSEDQNEKFKDIVKDNSEAINKALNDVIK